MKKYRVQNESWASKEFDSLEEAEIVFERWKEEMMSEGVHVGDSLVEIVEYDDETDDDKVIKMVIAEIDKDRVGNPRDEGRDFDYWAKWQEVEVEPAVLEEG